MILYKQLLVLQEENKILKAEIAELKNRLNQNSNNSHKSPSSDMYRKRTHSKPAFPKNPEDKKPLGGQEGLEGKTLNITDLLDLVELLNPRKIMFMLWRRLIKIKSSRNRRASSRV